MTRRPCVVWVVTEGWFFLSHFRYMADALMTAGYRVVVVTRAGDSGGEIRRLGFELVDTGASRSSLSPIALGRNIATIAGVLRREHADVMHLVALRSIVLGGMASLVWPRAVIVAAPTGLGHAWSADGGAAGLYRLIARAMMKFIRARNGAFIFENRDDIREFGFDYDAGGRTILVPGAGVDPLANAVLELPAAIEPFKVAVFARMLRAKGIDTAIDAVRRARASGALVELDIYGAPDEDNPDSLSVAELERWSGRDGIRWHGHVGDVQRVLSAAHAVMLLTRYREGLPRALIEGAAAGRALIATDTPGCRDIVQHGTNGYLVDPLQAAEEAAAALRDLARDGDMVRRMGAASRQKFVNGFTRSHVVDAVVALYGRCLTRPSKR